MATTPVTLAGSLAPDGTRFVWPAVLPGWYRTGQITVSLSQTAQQMVEIYAGTSKYGTLRWGNGSLWGVWADNVMLGTVRFGQPGGPFYFPPATQITVAPIGPAMSIGSYMATFIGIDDSCIPTMIPTPNPAIPPPTAGTPFGVSFLAEGDVSNPATDGATGLGWNSGFNSYIPYQPLQLTWAITGPGYATGNTTGIFSFGWDVTYQSYPVTVGSSGVIDFPSSLQAVTVATANGGSVGYPEITSTMYAQAFLIFAYYM